MVFLREKPIVAIVKQFIRRLHQCCSLIHGEPPNALQPDSVNVRVVLAAYMIALRPSHVFESMGTLEQSLFEAAVLLVNRIEILVNDLASKNAFYLLKYDLVASFTTILYEYLKRFKAWKVPDEAKLTCRIKHALIALYQAETHLPPEEPEDSKLKIEFRTQIERLRCKLQQIAGIEALTQFDEMRSRGVTAFPGPSGACGQQDSCVGAYASLPGRMTNEQLAHELLLDPTFQLDEHGGCNVENPVFHRIRESFHQVLHEY